MFRPFSLAFIAISPVLLNASHSLAWNRAGHMVSGPAAYFVLKSEHLEAQQRALAILKQQADFDHLGKTKTASVREKDRDLHRFMLAARWPDELKSRAHQIDHDQHVSYATRKGTTANGPNGE